MLCLNMVNLWQFYGQDCGFARGRSDVLRRLISDFCTSLGYDVPRQMFGFFCRKSEPSADFMPVGLFPFLTFLASLECSCGITV